MEEGLVRAKEAARQALELDDSLAEADASLAWVLFIYDWDWEGAEREFRQSIALDPRYAPARQWYSMHLAAMGRHEQSIIEAHAALELDPVSVSVRRSVAWAYYYARHYESARQYLSRAITMNPSAEETFRLLGLVLGQLGQWSECAKVLRQALQLSGNGPYYRATLGWALANSGDRAGAEAILAALTRESQSSYVSPVGFATIHLGLGNREPALAYTEKALVERRGWLAYLKTNPILDQLRPEPGFKTLLERMKLS